MHSIFLWYYVLWSRAVDECKLHLFRKKIINIFPAALPNLLKIKFLSLFYDYHDK